MPINAPGGWLLWWVIIGTSGNTHCWNSAPGRLECMLIRPEQHTGLAATMKNEKKSTGTTRRAFLATTAAAAHKWPCRSLI